MTTINYIAKMLDAKGGVLEYILKLEDLDVNSIDDRFDLHDNPRAKRVDRFILKTNLITKKKFYSRFNDFQFNGSSTFIVEDYIFENGTVVLK